jgi:hypothetical protein
LIGVSERRQVGKNAQGGQLSRARQGARRATSDGAYAPNFIVAIFLRSPFGATLPPHNARREPIG